MCGSVQRVHRLRVDLVVVDGAVGVIAVVIRRAFNTHNKHLNTQGPGHLHIKHKGSV